jgi:hypothetical protein
MDEKLLPLECPFDPTHSKRVLSNVCSIDYPRKPVESEVHHGGCASFVSNGVDMMFLLRKARPVLSFDACAGGTVELRSYGDRVHDALYWT